MIQALWKQTLCIMYRDIYMHIFKKTGKDIHQTVKGGYSWSVRLERVKRHSLFISYIFVLTAYLISIRNLS